MVDVRKADRGERVGIAATLANAFANDPVCCWMSGLDDCEARMVPFWRSLVKTNLAKSDEVYVADDLSGVAMWRGVDDWKLPPLDVARAVPALMRSLRLRLPLALQLLGKMEKAHPTAPHYYLEFLGTRRDRQSKGIGTAVLAPILARCDAEGVPAYLESSNPRNIAFYARQGFVESGVVSAPKDGPKMTTMWREPR